MIKSYIRTKEHKEKMSRILKGRKITSEWREKIGLANRGKRRTEEENKKRSEMRKGFKFSKESNIKRANSMRGQKRSLEQKERISLSLKGKFTREHNPNWKGGISALSHLIRTSREYELWRQRIFIRDDFICQKCSKKGGTLNVHHIKKFSILLKEAVTNLPLLPLYEAAILYSPLWDIDNGITLCKGCHKKVKQVILGRYIQWLMK